MTRATTVTKPKPVRQSRYCKNSDCKKQFKVAPASRKLYCQASCSTKIQNKKRPRVDRLDKARRTPFFFYLARECKRAGTLQVLTGHTAESVVALYAVWKFAFRVNRYGECRDFELSHIAPVEGPATLGLLCAENLCVSPKSLNKAHGIQYFGYGKKISRTSILTKHHVASDEAEGLVLDRVIAYLGEQLVDDVVRIAKLQPSQRSKHLDWLNDNLDPVNPEHRKHIAALSDMTTVALSNLKNQLQDKLASAFAVKKYTFKPFDVLYRELERHVEYRPDLQEVLDVLQQVNESMTYKTSWNTQPDEDRALFNLLHGLAVADVQDAIDVIAHRNTPVIDYGTVNAYGGNFVPQVLERTPAYAPIKFPAQKVVVQDAPARVLATLNVMLDSEAPDNGYSFLMVAPAWEVSADQPPF